MNGNLISTHLIDPVPYLDILGVAEGSINLICASLPTLGPLFRFARGTFTSRGSNRSMLSQSNDDTEGQPNDINNGNWIKVKSNKLEDLERESTGVASTTDDIPLVPTTKQQKHGKQ